MATVAPLVAKPKTRNQFCHLYSHMVPMPHSESKSDLKQLRYWEEEDQLGPLPKHSVVVDWTLVSSGGGGGGGKHMPNIMLLLTGHLGQVVEEEEEEDQLDR